MESDCHNFGNMINSWVSGSLELRSYCRLAHYMLKRRANEHPSVTSSQLGDGLPSCCCAEATLAGVLNLKLNGDSSFVIVCNARKSCNCFEDERWILGGLNWHKMNKFWPISNRIIYLIRSFTSLPLNFYFVFTFSALIPFNLMKWIKFIKHFWSYSKLIFYFLQKFIFICAKKKLSCLLRFSFTNSRKIFDDMWLLLPALMALLLSFEHHRSPLSYPGPGKTSEGTASRNWVRLQCIQETHFRNNAWMVIGSLITPPAPSECLQGETSIVN